MKEKIVKPSAWQDRGRHIRIVGSPTLGRAGIALARGLAQGLAQGLAWGLAWGLA